MAFAELWGGTAERSADGVTWSRIAQVTSVTVPPVTKTYRDRTSMDSAARVREYGSGFSDTGEISIRAYYDSDGYAAGLADEARADGTYYRLTLSDGAEFTFLAIVTVELEGLEMDADAMITISGKVSGDITFTPAP